MKPPSHGENFASPVETSSYIVPKTAKIQVKGNHDSGRPNEAQRQPPAPRDPSAAHRRIGRMPSVGWCSSRSPSAIRIRPLIAWMTADHPIR
ncbi:hypothetical protein WG66_011374 [Moniliophthora roreri]|nr:hypothetical protein WG66_011374 [Moniliophthora roreri]